MSIFNPVDKQYLKEENFTHKGWLAFCVPIYIDYSTIDTEEGPFVIERNGVPEFMVPLVCRLIGLFGWIVNFGGLIPAWDIRFPVLITGEIE